MIDLRDLSLHDIAGTVKDSLVGGPRRCSEVAEDLLDDEDLFDEGQLDSIRRGEAPPGELERLVIDAVLDDDDVWVSSHPDPVLALTEPFFDDLVLTHRLTAEEVDKGEVLITPDLAILDWGAGRDGLLLGDGGRLAVVRHRHVPGEDTSTFAGPPGWLSGFAAGDLVTFHRTDALVTIGPAGRLEPDEHQVELLREASQRVLRRNEGQESPVFVLDALTVDPAAFRRPVRPIGELLEAAGLERRGFSHGPAGPPWKSAGERARELQRLRLRRMYDFAACCEKAYDRVMDTIYALGAPDGDPAELATAEVGEALAHGWVAAAVVEAALDMTGVRGPDWSEPVVDLAETLTGRTDADPGARAAGRFLLAVDARRRGEALAAESHLRLALTDAPGHHPSARDLAAFEVDRSDLAAAVSLMERVGPSFTPHYDLVEDLHRQIEAPYLKAGRNQPCPCGSGRKFKACCLTHRRLLPRLRGALMDLKLLLFLRESDRHRHRLRMLAAGAVPPRGPEDFGAVDETVDDPVMADFLAFEGGGACDYLAERGPLLPAEEQELLQAALDEPRRLWRIVDVGPGPYIVVSNDETGRTVSVHDPVAAEPESIGVLLLWRIARSRGEDHPLGFQLRVEPEAEKLVREMVDDGPSAQALARWYATEAP